ncbi:MAG: non-heme iron oxygenase ferredoxin subunit [Pirellulaceae bacterium]|nr:non-heme iron oxygenase ferredoxin subunit [Pirellulaceae bacterium]
MSEFIEVAKLSAIPVGGKLCVEIDDRYIVLVHLDGTVYCIDDVCTHDGGPLGEGELIDHCLVCPRHGAKFDIRTGAAVCMPATEATGCHTVRIEGDKIFVKLVA